MPKRACPFPETFSSQYKIHVGEQELNNYGVFGNKYRQEIYGKPLLAVASLVVAHVGFVDATIKQSRRSLIVRCFAFL